MDKETRKALEAKLQDLRDDVGRAIEELCKCEKRVADFKRKHPDIL